LEDKKSPSKMIGCPTKECPFCEAGIPVKVIVPITDLKTHETCYLTMSRKHYEKYYKSQFDNV
jgi:hypothetical protein